MRRFIFILLFFAVGAAGCDLVKPRRHKAKAALPKEQVLQIEPDEDMAVAEAVVRPVLGDISIERDLFKPLVVKPEPVKPVVVEKPPEPEVKEPVIPPVATGESLGLTFLGVVTAGESTALIGKKDGVLMVKLNTFVDGMKVRVITRDRLVLEDPYGRPVVLDIKKKSPDKPLPGRL